MYEEALNSLPPDGDRLEWWRHHKDLLPLLARLAQDILRIPCNSSKLETVFSIGGQVSNGQRAGDFFCVCANFDTKLTMQCFKNVMLFMMIYH